VSLACGAAVAAIMAATAIATTAPDKLTVYAGSYRAFAFEGDGGPAISARLNDPTGVAADAHGDVFIVDSVNNRIREVKPSGTISTFLRTAGQPLALTIDAAGILYITAGERVQKVTPAGVATTIAGTGQLGFAGDGGPATQAQLDDPDGLAVDGQGDVYIADSENQRVREVTAGGIIRTIAGTGAAGFSGDGGPATAAQLATPDGVAVNADGNVYIADGANNRVRQVTPAGVIRTVAGTGTAGFSGDGDAATAAELSLPVGLTLDSRGNLYIADSQNGRIRQVTPAGTITTVAGGGSTLGFPTAVAVDGTGVIYIADQGLDEVWRYGPALAPPSPVVLTWHQAAQRVRFPVYRPRHTLALTPTGPTINESGCLLAGWGKPRSRRGPHLGLYEPANTAQCGQPGIANQVATAHIHGRRAPVLAQCQRVPRCSVRDGETSGELLMFVPERGPAHYTIQLQSTHVSLRDFVKVARSFVRVR
jgi:sugar lactone lactonase YvrE